MSFERGASGRAALAAIIEEVQNPDLYEECRRFDSFCQEMYPLPSIEEQIARLREENKLLRETIIDLKNRALRLEERLKIIR